VNSAQQDLYDTRGKRAEGWRKFACRKILSLSDIFGQGMKQ